MIHTTLIAKIERYSGGTADLEPLFLDDNSNPYPKIINARALKVNGVNPDYSKGEVVAVAVSERDFSDAIQGKKGNGGSHSSHELTSAIVLGAIT